MATSGGGGVIHIARRGRRPLETGLQNRIKAVEIRSNSLSPSAILLPSSSPLLLALSYNSNLLSSPPRSTFPRQSHTPLTMKFFKSIAFALPLFAAFASAAPAVEQREIAVVSDRQLTQLPLADALEGVLDKVVRTQVQPYSLCFGLRVTRSLTCLANRS